MSTEYTIPVEKRSDLGKGSSRRLRREQGLIPAIIYGGESGPVSITLDIKDFIRQLKNEAFFAHIIELDMAGTSEKVVLKDLQRHPVSGFPIHADFLRIKTGQQITMRVPLHFINEDICVGVDRDSGRINHQLTDLEINCLPKDLPEYIEVDVAALEIGDSIHISDLKLPAGVESVALSHGDDQDQNYSVAVVLPPKLEVEEDEDEAPEPTEVEVAPKGSAKDQDESSDD